MAMYHKHCIDIQYFVAVGNQIFYPARLVLLRADRHPRKTGALPEPNRNTARLLAKCSQVQ